MHTKNIQDTHTEQKCKAYLLPWRHACVHNHEGRQTCQENVGSSIECFLKTKNWSVDCSFDDEILGKHTASKVSIIRLHLGKPAVGGVFCECRTAPKNI